MSPSIAISGRGAARHERRCLGQALGYFPQGTSPVFGLEGALADRVKLGMMAGADRYSPFVTRLQRGAAAGAKAYVVSVAHGVAKGGMNDAGIGTHPL